MGAPSAPRGASDFGSFVTVAGEAVSIIEGERVRYGGLAMSLGTAGPMLGAPRGVVQ
jgi:hypothetical protein